MAVRVTVKGEQQLAREMRRLQRSLGLKGGEWADYGARAVRDGVVRNAQPFGTGKKAREKGENAILGDLLRCFRVVPDVMTSRRGVISSVGAAREWHQSRRSGSRMRVRKGKRRRITSSIFKTYSESVIARVGMAKASVAGGEDPRLKSRIPRWIKQWTDTGEASRRRSPQGAVWKFSAEPKAAGSDDVLGERGVRRVMRKQERLVYGAMKRDFRRELKKRERRVNGG